MKKPWCGAVPTNQFDVSQLLSFCVASPIDFNQVRSVKKREASHVLGIGIDRGCSYKICSKHIRQLYNPSRLAFMWLLTFGLPSLHFESWNARANSQAASKAGSVWAKPCWRPMILRLTYSFGMQNVRIGLQLSQIPRHLNFHSVSHSLKRLYFDFHKANVTFLFHHTASLGAVH